MKVIVTGSTGFVGKNLLSYFNNAGIGTVPYSLRVKEQELKWGPSGCRAIVHLAGKAHDTKNTSKSEEYFQINTELTKQMFDQFVESELKDFFFFSSVKAVADSVNNILDESAIPSPLTPYGQSKWEAEKYLNSQPLPSGKRLFILRPCMIHGPGNKGNLNLLYSVVKKQIPYPLAAFSNRRSFLSIENLLFVLKALVENPDIPGGTYNLADDEAISTNELIRLIGEARGKRTQLWHLPVSLIRGLASLGDMAKLPLNSERLKKLTESYVVDNSKIKAALKIEHMPVSTRDGLLKTLRSF